MGRYRDTTLTDFGFLPELPYYDHVRGELKGTQISKAKKFVQLGCVVQVKDNEWKVRPIKGYNKRTYTVINDGDGWKCNCQFNRTRGRVCSHILAVWILKGYINI